MRKRFALSLVFCLTLPGVALAADFNEVRHLLSRATFGGTASEITALLSLNYADAVERLLGTTRRYADTAPPDWVDDPPPDFRKLRQMDEQNRKNFRRQQLRNAGDLQAWWYREMLTTDSPLTEHMTLFWHNHFTSGLRKVKWPQLLYRQNVLLRRHALGNFRALLHDIAKDPAMILYLDNQTNRVGQPNENFARELMELFTLGEGHYTEQDIKAAARAFTGWAVNRKTGKFQLRRHWHDNGIKTFFGKSGRFGGEEIIDIILEQPRVAVFISEKLWRAFISDTPDSSEVNRLAAVFRDNNYELKPLLRALFTSSHFRAASNRGTQIKSPVELVVGTLRQFDIPIENYRGLVRAGRGLGQDIFNPPNVKGWPGGTRWIDANTLLLRQHLLQRAYRGKEMGSKHTSGKMARGTLPKDSLLSESQQQQLMRLLLPLAPVNTPITNDRREFIAALLNDPVYQLK